MEKSWSEVEPFVGRLSRVRYELLASFGLFWPLNRSGA